MSDDDLELDHPTEIAALIDEAVQEQVRLHLENPSGEALELLPLDVDRAQGWMQLRLPGLLAQAPDWLLQGPVHAHAVLDKVRIDFEVGAERRLSSEGGLPVLQLALPTRMRRHQRRQAFRVAPVSQHHPRAVVPVAGQTRPLRLSTQDLSAGGVALLWPESIDLPTLDQRLEGVEVELERELRVSVSLSVEHVRRNPRGEWVVGCAFVNLASQAERQLLLHLNQLQRRHRVIGAR